MFIRKNLKYYLFVTIATLFIGIAFTSADFFTSPAYRWKDILILFLQWSILMIALWVIVYCISLNKYLFALLYPLICLFSSVLMYFRYTTGTTLTTMILDAALDNDKQISMELINLWLIIIVVSSLVTAGLFVIYRFRKLQKLHKVYVHCLISILLFLLVFNIPNVKRPIAQRPPFNLYFVTAEYFSEKKEVLTKREILSNRITCGEQKDLIVLFVLGESLRADHLGFNGYERNTTPYLSREDIISFPRIYSEYTHTNASVPHILTRSDSIYPDRANTERSFIDLFKHCGFYTVWLANQESAKTYVYFMNECDTLIYKNMNKSPYVFDKWIDEDLFPPFESFIKSTGNRLIIMHTIGSHWYYNSHFPDEFQKYNPIVKSRIVKSNTPEEMINSYDNTVLYTDYFIYEIINRLKNKNAILFYLSDHGEALGEEGMWLHANEATPLHYPACFVWMSPLYKDENSEKYKVLQDNKMQRYRTDFLFHTLLEAADIQSDVIDEKFSLFHTYQTSSCD